MGFSSWNASSILLLSINTIGGTTTRHITRFWHRRSSEVILLITFAISSLFAWNYFGDISSVSPSLEIPFLSGILAIATFIIVLISYFATPLPQIKASSYLNYILTALTITLLVIQTGGVESPFLSLFIACLPFASLLGGGGVVAGLVLLSGFTTQQYMMAGLATSQLIELSLVGGVALLAGCILWSRSESATNETKEDRSYHELASQLSQVAGKSDVVINVIGDGVLALNAQGVTQLINPAAERSLGWQSHDALNLSYKSVIKFLDSKNQAVEEINDPVAKVLSTNKPIKIDSYSMVTQSGKSFLAEVSVSPVGQPGEGAIIVFRDITTEKSDERQRAEFISTASHEMRTPVASIEGYLGLVLNPNITSIDEKARDYVTKAHESARHLGRLFSDLLDVSKADDSRLKNDPKVVDVVPFIHDIVEGLTPKAQEKGLTVLYKPMPESSNDRKPELSERRLTPVYYSNVDNDHLREIIQNLTENAIKYTLKGNVTIDVGGDDKHIVVSIADTGIGIPREDQSHLFQKFYRVDNSDTREIGGTGLGLYLCRRLTETIGGRLWVESEYKHGSTFFIEIPRIGHDEATKLIEQASVEAEHATATTQPASFTPPEPQIIPEQQTYSPALDQPVVQYPQPTGVASFAQPPLAQYPPAQPPQQQPSNTPLSAIEANPSQYIVDRRAQSSQISVPPRQQ